MKKVTSLLLVLVMCLTLCVPAFAKESRAAIPDGYTFLTTNRVNATATIEAFSMVAGAIAGVTLGLADGGIVTGLVVDIVVDTSTKWLGHLLLGDKVNTYYIDYIYECDDPGIYPYIYFHVAKHYISNPDGSVTYLKETTWYEYALLPR